MKAIKFYQNYWHELWLVFCTLVISIILCVLGCPHCTPKNWLLFGIVGWLVLLVLCEIFMPRCSWRYEGAYAQSWIISTILSCIACFIWMKSSGIACTILQTSVIIGGYMAIYVIGILLQNLSYRLFDEAEKLEADKQEYIKKYGQEAYDWNRN